MAGNLLFKFVGDPFCDNVYQCFGLAQIKNFKCVEIGLSYMEDIERLKSAREITSVDAILINSPPEGGVKMHGDEQFGLACLPGAEVDLSLSLHKAITYASALNSKLIHVLAGLKPSGYDDEELMVIYINNLKAAADMLEEHNLTIVIEPIGSPIKENYFLTSYSKTMDYCQEIDKPNVKLLLDVCYLYTKNNKVEDEILNYLPYTEYIRISPSRNKYGVAPGEIDYNALFKVLKDNQYSGYIGIEYTLNDSLDIFKWLRQFGING